MTVVRPKGPRPLAEIVAGLLTPACRKRGVANAALMLSPVDIFGERFARSASVERIVWPKGSRIDETERGGATLVVAADGATALALQHVAPQIVERVNILIGWPAVARLRITQAPWRGAAGAGAGGASTAQARDPATAAAAAATAAPSIGDLANQDLKAALTRLGAAVYRRGSSHRRQRP